MKNVLLIINPKAGKMKSKMAMYNIVSRFCDAGWKVRVQTTLHSGHAAELAAEAGRDFDLCVCCGGDGTLNEMINGMLNSKNKIPIGYIPAGTTNDFATSMDIPQDVNRATDNILRNEPIEIDIGKFENRFFSYIASFGAFTAASYNTTQTSKNTLGHLAYVLEGIRDLPSLQPYQMTVNADDFSCSGEYIFGAVSNSTSVGGIVKLNPDIVDMCDGIFEVLLIKCPKNAVELSRVVHGITVSDFSDEMFDFFRSSKITFEMEHAIPWSLDGEYDPGAKKVTVINEHCALMIRK